MILDEYYCEDCGKKEEVFRETVKELYSGSCKQCDGKMKKVFLTVPVHYKGNGWASKGSALLSKPRKTKAETGIKIDYDKKREMKLAGEKV